MNKLAASSLLALALALPATLAAAPPPACGGIIVDDGTLVFGEVHATGHLGVCARRPSGVIVFYDVPTCDTATPRGNVIRLSSSGGGTATTTVAPAVISINCGGVTIDPFPTAFQFGLWFTGYNATDIAYGTPNRDYLHGNSYVPWAVDGAADTLCGYGDDDVLVGDGEPVAAGLEACMNGGAGLADHCANGYNLNCELFGGTYLFPATTDCGCGAAPPQIW